MKVETFSFELPEELIAQVPAARRDASRLMILDRGTGEIVHRRFADFPEHLAAGDLLVLNDTKVLPARLRGTKTTGGQVEVLLLEQLAEARDGSEWRALLTGGKSIRPGMEIAIEKGLTAIPLERCDDVWRIRLLHAGREARDAVEDAGDVPLPPYIRRSAADPRGRLDRERYQTVYARYPGAVAAPTAGLHLTHEILSSCAVRGVETAFVTLHAGFGTFAPVRVQDVEAHRIHDEAFSIPEATAEAVSRTRARGGRVVAVGTTVSRTLETRADDGGCLTPGSGRSSLFIYPGFRFRVVDALLTNFHLPRSTLLMLVCAFAGTAHVLAAYEAAVRERYRFFSYGDAMLVRGA
jgi:S-adenosylmethionine:tRNA ribosyltransferase-isomerase